MKTLPNPLMEAASKQSGDETFPQNNNWSTPMAEDIQRRANQRFIGSAEYLDAIRKADLAHKAAKTPPPRWPRITITIGGFDPDPRLVAILIALMIFLGIVAWVGYEVHQGIQIKSPVISNLIADNSPDAK